MFEWIKDYRELKSEIDYLEHKLEGTEEEYRRWASGDLSGIKLNEKSKAAKLEEDIKSIKEEIYNKKTRKEKLIRLVDTFPGLDNQIVKLKYIDGLTLAKIAEKTGYSESHIRNRHSAIVRTMKFVEKYK